MNPTAIEPFVGGCLVGAGVTLLIAIGVCRKIVDKMSSAYDMRIRSRDTRIQLLLERMAEMERNNNRKELMRQIHRPMR